MKPLRHPATICPNCEQEAVPRNKACPNCGYKPPSRLGSSVATVICAALSPPLFCAAAYLFFVGCLMLFSDAVGWLYILGSAIALFLAIGVLPLIAKQFNEGQ